MSLEEILAGSIKDCIQELFNESIDHKVIQLQKTRKEFEGDITLVTFPLLRITKKSPEQTSEVIGEYLHKHVKMVEGYNVVKGFLNLEIGNAYWLKFFKEIGSDQQFGFKPITDASKTVMVEYSSPNTNKPLHLGHIRNNLLGYAIAQIMDAVGNKVVKTNIVNDRGIHICKSMLAWQKWGNNETPQSTDKKGDHLVGDYYVKFDQEYKKEVAELVEQGITKEEAENQSALIQEARTMLQKWEAGDAEVNKLWVEMNGWVYDGFDVTYKKLGVDFDKIYFESDTYKLGKKHVLKGLDAGVFYQKEDQSVWADLSQNKLDHKLLLRSDGTSVYMTQDIGTAMERFADYNFDSHIYVVGNEQDYHFKVLPILLQRLDQKWAEALYHLSYGMVELPEGKMKSREGTVVDADDLIEEMISTARSMSNELGKLDGYSEEERENIFRIIGLGALKYFILKVDPKKNMTFNPQESIDFNGNTGPFIQYTYARIQSVLNKADQTANNWNISECSDKERSIIQLIYEFPQIISDAAGEMNPAVIANYVYSLAKEYNQFYHDHSILKEEDEQKRLFRLNLSSKVATMIQQSMNLLGIEVPERM